MKRLLAMLVMAGAMAWGADGVLMEADRAFDKATLERGLEGWLEWFSDDARVNGAQGEVVGKAQLREFYKGMFAQKEFSIRWQPLHEELSADGAFGYTYGVSQISFRDEKGQLQERRGRYLTVWRKQKDGKWKVITDIGS